MDKVVQIGTPVVSTPSNESKGVEGKTSTPETPAKEKATVRNKRK